MGVSVPHFGSICGYKIQPTPVDFSLYEAGYHFNVSPIFSLDRGRAGLCVGIAPITYSNNGTLLVYHQAATDYKIVSNSVMLDQDE